MKTQVILLLCILSGGFAIPRHPEESDSNESNELERLLADISEATERWNSLHRKFQQMEKTDCASPEKADVCQSIREQVNSLGGERDSDKQMKTIETALVSLKEKLDKLDRKMESGVAASSISNMDHINAMRSLERRLRYIQMAAMNMGKDVRLSARHVDDTDEESGTDLEGDDVKHLGKSCKLLVAPYKKLLISVERLESVVRGMSAKDDSRLRKMASYKASPFKDIKDTLEDVADEVKALKKMSGRELNENQKILKKIYKKLEEELKDDDEDDEDLKKSLKKYMLDQRKQLEKSLKKMLKDDKDTDTDTDDDDDDDDDDNDDARRKGKRRKDDTDDDDDDDTDDDDCDDDDECEESNKNRKRNRKDDTDDDSDDDDDDDDKRKGKGKPKMDETDSDDDDDDDDDDKKKSKSRRRNRETLSDLEDVDSEVEIMKNIGKHRGRQRLVTSLFVPLD